MLSATLAFFTDPNTEMWMKGIAALMLLLLSGFGWMLLKRFVPVLGKPLRWYRERQAWQAVAAREGWMTAVTRKFSGNRDGQPWRMRAHLQDAWITEEDESPPPTQAQWQMKDGAWSGRVVVIPKAVDEVAQTAAQARAAASSGGDAANVALAAAGIVGLLAGQSWGSAALGWATDRTADDAGASGLSPVAVGSSRFQDGYVVRTDSPALARGMITPEAEAMLTALHRDTDPANAFMVEMNHNKFSMRYLGDFSEAERAANFCKLGLALTRGLAT